LVGYDIAGQFGAAGCKKKTTSKQAKELVKSNSRSQVRTQNLQQDLPSSRKQK